MNYFDNLSSKKVFQYFEEISKIPRCSGNEKALSDFLIHFAKERNLEYYQDDIYNVIIKKPASPGYEDVPSIALQGHLDMVCEKNSNIIHDFSSDPINLIVKDDLIYADGTTLGADNGIAVAMAMAILDADDINHPKLEIILTVQEETGLTGAINLDAEKIDSQFLINIDSEEEGKFLSSCAGGLRSTIELPVEWTYLETEYETYKISVTGLLGGHSGMQIDLGRGNSICILGRILNDFQRFLKYEIFEVKGGSKDNVIPREAYSVIAIKAGTCHILNNLAADWNTMLNKEYQLKENKISIQFEKLDNYSAKILNSKSKQNLLFVLNLHPNGINTMSAHIPGLVESSLSLGVLSTDVNHIYFSSAIRSSVKSIKHDIAHKLRLLSAQVGSVIYISNEYPEWSYNSDSKIRDLFTACYRSLFKKEAEVIAIHAGVECGIFMDKFKNMDMISFGPDMYDVHSPDEHISISSVENCYRLLINVLENSKKL